MLDTLTRYRMAVSFASIQSGNLDTRNIPGRVQLMIEIRVRVLWTISVFSQCKVSLRIARYLASVLQMIGMALQTHRLKVIEAHRIRMHTVQRPQVQFCGHRLELILTFVTSHHQGWIDESWLLLWQARRLKRSICRDLFRILELRRGDGVSWVIQWHRN